MQDAVDRIVKEIAVVADNKHRVGISGDEVLEPQRAFEIEIIGRLVEKQNVGRSKQRSRQSHPLPPSAGKLGARTLLRLLVETEAGQNARGPSRGGMRIDIAEPCVDFADAMRIVRGLGLRGERRQFRMRRQHRLEQVSGPPGAS